MLIFALLTRWEVLAPFLFPGRSGDPFDEYEKARSRKRRKQMSIKFKTAGHEEAIADKLAEQEGIWVDLNAPIDMAFLVRRAGGSNFAYQRRLSALLRPHAFQIQSNTMDPERLNEIYVQVFCEACLVDWERVLDDKDQPVEYSPEAGMEFFKVFPDIYKILEKQANDLNQYSRATIEAAKKSSSKS